MGKNEEPGTWFFILAHFSLICAAKKINAEAQRRRDNVLRKLRRCSIIGFEKNV